MAAFIPERPGHQKRITVGDTKLDEQTLRGTAGAHAALLVRETAPGSRIGVWAEPAVGSIIAMLAALDARRTVVPLNPNVGDAELAHIANDARLTAITGSDPARSARTPSLPFLTIDREARKTTAPREVDDDEALILYTSGTTGRPKGAVHSTRNLALGLAGLAEAWDWRPDDEVVHALPIFHVHGLVLGVFGALRAGGAVSWIPRFDAEGFIGALHEKAMIFAVPTIVHRLLDRAERDETARHALRTVRLFVSGSAGLPQREHKRALALLGRPIIERYGLTETLILTAVRHDRGEPGRVGAPVRGVELRLVTDQREQIDAHDDATIGEVAVRSPFLFSGYLNNADATNAVMDDDGWFYTGDLATRDGTGSIRIVGRRATDLIKTGGFKVGAGEIESALLERLEVAEAAVVGLPDDDLGERIVAFVVAREGSAIDPQALIDHVAKTLAVHKRPREVRILTALPRNAMGKITKPLLR